VLFLNNNIHKFTDVNEIVEKLAIFDPKLSDLNQIQADFVITIWNCFKKALN
jgi:hypothetical protein